MAESLRDLVVNLSLNGDNFSQNINAINKQIKEAESAFSAASAGVDGFEHTLEGSRAKVDALTKKYELQSRAVEQYQKALTASENKLSQSAAKQAELNQALADAKAEYEAVAEAEGKDSDAAKALADRIKTLEGQIAANEKTMQKQAQAVTTASTNLNNARAALGETEAALRDANAEAAKAGSNWTKLGASLDTFAQKAQKVGQNLSSTGRSLTVGVTAPIVALATACVKSFNDVDKGLDIVVTKTGATGQALESMQDSMKTVFGDLAVDASEAGSAIGEVNTRFQMTGETLEQTAAEFLKFSKITGTDVSTAIDDVDSVMEKFGIDSTHVNEVLGLVAKVGQDTGISVSALTSSLKTNGASLKEIGLTLEDSIMLLAQFERNGVDASTALMGIKTAVKNSAKDGQDAQTALRDTMAAIRDATNETDALTLAIELFGSRGAAEMTDAIRTGRINIDELSTSMAQYAEVVNETYEATLDLPDQAKVAFNNLKLAGSELASTAFETLVPLATTLIGNLKEIVAYIGTMDQSTVLTVIRIAAIAAAAGPLVSLAGKLVTGIGSVTGALGKFATAIGAAGGGFSGFASVLKSSPSVWIALAAAIGVAVYKIADYASGAKAAREAMESLNKSATDWTDNAASTFYSQGQGLERFGMSANQFAGDVENAHRWLARLTAEWGDDYVESEDTVNSYVESWRNASKVTTDALQEIADSAAENGYDALYKQTKGYIAEINTIDDRMEALLKKKREYALTDEEIAELQSLINRREEIELEYKIKTVDTDGFTQLDEAIDAAQARAKAAGQQLGMDFYQDAMLAAAEGAQAVNQAIDDEYDARYKVIQLMDEGTAKVKAQAELDSWYQQQRQAAAEKYMNTLADYVGEVWNNSDYKQVYSDMGKLLSLMDQYKTSGNSTELAEFIQTLDPDKITEYYGVMTQITDLMSQGMSLETIGEKLGLTPEDVQQIYDSFDQIEFLQGALKSFSNDELLNPVREIFDDLGKEVLKIATDLDMDGASAAWKAWAENPGADILALLDESGLPEQIDIPGQVTSDGVIRYPDGTKPDEIIVAVLHSDGTIDNKPDSTDVTAYVTSDGKVYYPDGTKPKETVTATLNSDGTISGAPESTTVTALISSDGTVTYTDGKTPVEDVKANLNSDGTVNGAPESKDVVAYMTSDGVIHGLPETVPVTVSPTLTDITSIQIALWRAKNAPNLNLDATVTPKTVEGAFGQDYFDELLALYNAGKVQFYDHNGATMEVTPEVLNALEKTDLVMGMSEDGTYHIAVRPDWQDKSPEEAAKAVEDALSAPSTNGVSGWFSDVDTSLERALELFGNLKEQVSKEYGFFGRLFGLDRVSSEQVEYLEHLFGEAQELEMSNSVLAVVNAMQNGEKIDDATLASLERYIALIDYMNEFEGGKTNVKANQTFMTNLVQGLRLIGVEIDQNDIPGYLRSLVSAGEEITETMPEQSRASVVAAEDTAAYIRQIRALTGAFKEGQKTYEIYDLPGALMQMREAGQGFSDLLHNGGLQDAVDAIVGVAEAGGELSNDDLILLAEYSKALQQMGLEVPEEVSKALGEADFASIGYNIDAGIAGGINSGSGLVSDAVRAVIQEALAAGESEAVIHSPSQLFRDRIGKMLMRGIGAGIEAESRAQAEVVRNAMQYLTDEARGALSRQSYNIDSSVTVTGNTFSIRSDEDIGSLAREIAALTRRQQTGKGLRVLR